MMYRHFFKRAFDLVAALAAFLLLSPLFLLTTILLAFSNAGKPFFFQIRPGRQGKPFRIFKFKTMNDKKDAQGTLLSDAERLTPVGSMVRKLSLDEIPQFLNVIMGSMSIVGPRPLFEEDTILFDENYMRRLDVLPGMTGLLQINDRNTDDFETWFRYDLEYIENWSLLLDLAIILKTIPSMFKRKNSGL